MSAAVLVDLKTAVELWTEGSISVDLLKGAIAKGTLRAVRSKPADPKAGTPAGGKYLVTRKAFDDWIETLPAA